MKARKLSYRTCAFLYRTIGSKQDAKRAKPNSSPIHNSLDDVFLSKLEKIFKSRISILIHTCIGHMLNNLIPIIRKEIHAAIPSAIQQAIEAIMEHLKAEILKKSLFTKGQWTQARNVKNYNRRDNIRLIGVKENMRLRIDFLEQNWRGPIIMRSTRTIMKTEMLRNKKKLSPNIRV